MVALGVDGITMLGIGGGGAGVWSMRVVEGNEGI